MPDRTFAGNAGEYLVLGELVRRGVLAGLTPRNMHRYDIIAVNGDRAASIRVKSKSKATSWRWAYNEKSKNVFGDIGENDFVVLVDLGDDKTPISDYHVEYCIARTRDLESQLQKTFEEWLIKPGRGGRPHNPRNWERRFGDGSDDKQLLAEWKANGWGLVLDALGMVQS